MEEVLKYFPQFSDFGRQKFWLCCRLEEEQSGSWVGKRVRQSSAATAGLHLRCPALPPRGSDLLHGSRSLPLLPPNLAVRKVPNIRCFPNMDWSLLSFSWGTVSCTLEVEWKAWPEISATVNRWGCFQFSLYLLVDLCIDVIAHSL